MPDRETASGPIGLVQAFVNSVDLQDGPETLSTPEALAGWLSGHGLMSAGATADQGDLRHAVALREALRGVIGAIGSRKTNANRFEALRKEGFTEEEIGRVHGPIGLDLGSRGAEETALGILAELTAVRFGGSGASMKSTKAAVA